MTLPRSADIAHFHATYDLARQSAGITLRRLVFTLLALALASAALGSLSWWLRNHPFEDFDTEGLEEISSWHYTGVQDLFDTIATLTSAQVSAIVGIAIIAILIANKRGRLAFGIGLAGLIVAGLAIAADFTLGEYVGRTRPPIDNDDPSFPSGHAHGTLSFYGFAVYLAFHHRLPRWQLIPILLASSLVIAVSGISRVFQQNHWPSDLIGGYLLGSITLVLVIRIYRWLESVRWFSPPLLGRDIGAVPVRGVRLASSYASTVMLDDEAGTATKIFHPPFIIRMMYWMAFQARFPYDANPAALEAARSRREVAGYLTRYRFGKNLVAPILDVTCIGGRPAIVSRLIPGDQAPDDQEANEFLTRATLLLAQAGMPIWQLNPRNPHAHTNLIRTPEGDHVIVDLESAVPTPFPVAGHLKSTLSSGSFPVFDDIDFRLLNGYVDRNRSDMIEKLGPETFAEFETAIARAEGCTRAWIGAELRLVSRMVRVTYALLNWRGAFRRSRAAVSGADVKARAFLEHGIDEWVEEGRITGEQADRLRMDLRSEEARSAMRHLGAHLAITAFFRFPFGSILRPAWTLAFILAGLFRVVRTASRSCWGFLTVQNPVILLVSVVPGFGGFAYLLARPLRKAIFIRLMVDRFGRKIPLRLYSRSHLDRLVAPRRLTPVSPVSDAIRPVQYSDGS